MCKQIKRLRLKEGDLVVVRDQDIADALISAAKGMKGLPNCSIVVTKDSIHRLSAGYIRRLLAKKDAANAPTSAIAD